MKKYSKKLLYTFICILIGFIGGFTCLIYANNYSSEEISYDTRTSGAVQANVKDALDFLYSHGSCSEGMSCLESPIVTITVNGPGSVNKPNLSVPINGSSILEVTPNEGYVLQKVECNGGYEVGTYKEYSNEGAESKQNIEISNTRLFDNSTCTVTFGTNEISVSSTNLHPTYKCDICDSNESGCICYQIVHKISNFTYGSHTGCNFKSGSQTCYHTYNGSGSVPCEWINFNTGDFWGSGYGKIYDACSGVITCAT